MTTTLVVQVTFKIDVTGNTADELIAAALAAGEATMHPTNPSCEPQGVEVLVDRRALIAAVGA